MSERWPLNHEKNLADLKERSRTLKERVENPQHQQQRTREAFKADLTKREAQIKGQEKKQIAALRKSIGAINPETKEFKRERLLKKVLDESGITATFWVPRELEQSIKNAAGNHFEGYVPCKKRAKIGMSEKAIETQLGGNDIGRELAKRGVNEIIDFRFIREAIFENRVVPGNKGFLGIGKTPDKITKRFTGRFSEPKMCDKYVEDGNKEEAVQVTYRTATKPDYLEINGRRKAFSACFIMPKSIAKEVELAVNEDPSIMRDVVERAIKNNFLKNPGDWERQFVSRRPGANYSEHGEVPSNALRPPYEQWDSEPQGGRVYVQREGGEPGWHEKNIRTVKGK